MKLFKTLLSAALALLVPVAVAATVLWSSVNGDVNFSGLTPTSIDGMAIGNTTPSTGKFSTLDSVTGPTINGNAGTICVTVNPAVATDAVFFTATRPVVLINVSEVHAVAAGGASVVQIVKDTGTAAPGTGTDLLTNNTNTGFDLNATANTVQVGTLVIAATRTLAAGDRLAYDFANAIQSSAGINITACMQAL